MVETTVCGNGTANATGSTSPRCDVTNATWFNGEHLQIRISIDDDYACRHETDDCRRKRLVDFPGGVDVRTAWSARIDKDPGHLVE